jgi:hypothetical protein
MKTVLCYLFTNIKSICIPKQIFFVGRLENKFKYLRPDRLRGPPSLLYNEYRGLFTREKARPGRDADHSPPSSAEVKYE